MATAAEVVECLVFFRRAERRCVHVAEAGTSSISNVPSSSKRGRLGSPRVAKVGTSFAC